ncbi:16658_t:CDS:1, partial [Dentiscutata erythropus]
MTVASLTHLMIKRDLGSNKYSLKALLVGDMPTKIDNKNMIISMLVEDYTGQN